MTKKQLMVIIHKDTHYKISDNSDRVVQDLHGWYHPKFIELCKQYNIDYQLTEYEGYGDIFLGRFAQDKDDTEQQYPYLAQDGKCKPLNNSVALLDAGSCPPKAIADELLTPAPAKPNLLLFKSPVSVQFVPFQVSVRVV